MDWFFNFSTSHFKMSVSIRGRVLRIVSPVEMVKYLFFFCVPLFMPAVHLFFRRRIAYVTVFNFNIFCRKPQRLARQARLFLASSNVWLISTCQSIVPMFAAMRAQTLPKAGWNRSAKDAKLHRLHTPVTSHMERNPVNPLCTYTEKCDHWMLAKRCGS